MTSPLPPRRIAIAIFAGKPATRYAVSLLATGDGIALLSTPLCVQSSFPVAGSYEMIDSVPLVINSARFAVLTSNGVDQLLVPSAASATLPCRSSYRTRR